MKNIGNILLCQIVIYSQVLYSLKIHSSKTARQFISETKNLSLTMIPIGGIIDAKMLPFGITVTKVNVAHIYKTRQRGGGDIMAFCTNCGAELEAGAQFCGKCGMSFPKAWDGTSTSQGNVQQNRTVGGVAAQKQQPTSGEICALSGVVCGCVGILCSIGSDALGFILLAAAGVLIYISIRLGYIWKKRTIKILIAVVLLLIIFAGFAGD